MAELRCRLDSDFVIHGRSDPLCAAEIALGGLDRDVAEKKLNLLQLAPSGAAEAGTTPPEIMGCEFADANLIGELLDDVPDKLSVTASPQIRPALLTRRKRLPMVIPADVV